MDTTKTTSAHTGVTADHLHVEREREIHFFETHPELAGKLAGQWAVLDGDELISHGPDLASVLRQAHDMGHPHPFVTRVLDPAVTLVF